MNPNANAPFSFFEGLASNAASAISSQAAASQGASAGALAAISDTLAQVQASVIQLRIALLAAFVQIRLSAVAALTTVAVALGAALRSGLMLVVGSFSAVFRSVVGFLRGGAGLGVITSAARLLFDGVAGIFGGVFSVLRGSIPALASLLTQAVRGLFVALQMALQGAQTAISLATAPIRAVARFLVDTIRGVIKTTIDIVANTISTTISSVIHTAISASGGLLSGLGSLLPMAATIIAGLGGMIGTVMAALAPFAVAIVGVVGNLLAIGITKFFGAVAAGLGFIGRTITSAVSTVVPLVVNTITSAWGALRSALATVFTTLQSAVATLSSWASGLWSWASGLASKAIGFIGSNVGGIANLFSSVLSGLVNFGGALLKFVPAASVLGVFTIAVGAAAKSALDYSKAVQSLSSYTGFRQGTSAALINRFGAQGVSANAVQGLFQNSSPLAFDMKASAFGLPNFQNAGFAEALTRRFNSMNSGGPISQIMAQSMLKALGTDSPEWRGLLSTNPGTQRQNAAFSNRINSNLGLSPQALEGYGEQVPAMLTRIGTAISAIALKLASVALPLVERFLGSISSWLGSNAGKIASGVEGAMKWITGSIVPVFLESGQQLLTMSISMFKSFVDWSNLFVQNVEAVLSGASQAIGKTLQGWSGSFSRWSSEMIDGLANWLARMGTTMGSWISKVGNGVADQLDHLANWMQSVWTNQNNPFRVMVMGVAKFVDQIANFGRDLIGKTAAFAAGLNNVLLLSPVGIVMAKAAGLSTTIQSTSAAYSNAVSGVGVSDLEGTARRFFAGPTIPRAASGLANFSDGFRSKSYDLAASLADSMKNLSDSVRSNGMDGANRVTNGLYDAGSFFNPDKGTNPGAKIGNWLAEAAQPYVEGLNMLRDGVDSITGALGSSNQSYQENNSHLRELVQLQRENNGLVRGLQNEIRQNGMGGLDRAAGIVYNSFAREAAAIEMQG